MIKLFSFTVIFCSLGACASPQPASPALQGSRGDVIAIVFTSVDCPIANAMAPQLRRTFRSAREQGIRTYLVYPRAGVTKEAMEEHASAYALEAATIGDPDKKLVEQLGATVTPEGFVLEYVGPDRFNVRYRGRLNDLYPSIGNRRDQPTQFEFRDAILAVHEGRPVETPFPSAVGCMIERSR